MLDRTQSHKQDYKRVADSTKINLQMMSRCNGAQPRYCRYKQLQDWEVGGSLQYHFSTTHPTLTTPPSILFSPPHHPSYPYHPTIHLTLTTPPSILSSPSHHPSYPHHPTIHLIHTTPPSILSLPPHHPSYPHHPTIHLILTTPPSILSLPPHHPSYPHHPTIPPLTLS